MGMEVIQGKSLRGHTVLVTSTWKWDFPESYVWENQRDPKKLVNLSWIAPMEPFKNHFDAFKTHTMKAWDIWT